MVLLLLSELENRKADNIINKLSEEVKDLKFKVQDRQSFLDSYKEMFYRTMGVRDRLFIENKELEVDAEYERNARARRHKVSQPIYKPYKAKK